MKEKHLKILGGIFVFLLVIHFITKPRHTGVNLDEFVQNIVIGVSKEDIKYIEVYKETSSETPARMEFGLQDDKWRFLTKYNCKAQKSRIDRLLDDVLEMTGKVRSSDPKHFDKYKIADEQGIHLLIKDEGQKTLANLIIGKRGEDYGSGFVRFAGKDKVYAVDKNILSSLNVQGEVDTLTQFKDNLFIELQAVEQDKEDLEMVGLVVNRKETVIKKVEKEVEVKNEEDSTTTTKTETEWVLVKGKKEIELDQKEVENFFRDVAKIRAEEVVDRIGNTLADIQKNSRYGFSRPSHYIVFQKSEDERENVIFGKAYEKDKGYYMNVQNEGLVYKVTKYNYDKIFKWREELPKKLKKES